MAAVYAKRRVTVAPLPAPPHTQRAWHHIARTEDPEPDWLALRRPAAIAPLPVTPHLQKPWYRHLWDEEEPDFEALATRRHGRNQVTASLHKLRPYLPINV